MNTCTEGILRKSQLSITEVRKKILTLFLTHNGALTHSDFENNFGEKMDRVTVYRTLQAFVEKGIIHTIPTSDNSVQYALCKDNCSAGHHRHRHIHFVCSNCRNTYCLDDIITPEIGLPAGYSVNKVEVLVEGICSVCN